MANKPTWPEFDHWLTRVDMPKRTKRILARLTRRVRRELPHIGPPHVCHDPEDDYTAVYWFHAESPIFVECELQRERGEKCFDWFYLNRRAKGKRLLSVRSGESTGPQFIRMLRKAALRVARYEAASSEQEPTAR